MTADEMIESICAYLATLGPVRFWPLGDPPMPDNEFMRGERPVGDS